MSSQVKLFPSSQLRRIFDAEDSAIEMTYISTGYKKVFFLLKSSIYFIVLFPNHVCTIHGYRHIVAQAWQCQTVHIATNDVAIVNATDNKQTNITARKRKIMLDNTAPLEKG